MKYEFTKHSDNKSLIMFFTGWGMDATLFRNIDIHCNLVVIWDYEDFNIDVSLFNGYQSIYLFAWSFGVFAASQFINVHPSLPITFKMAINGTQFPIDDNRGIPQAMFSATLKNLSERSLMKFYRRICRDGNQFGKFTAHLPNRTIKSLHDELIYINASTASSKCAPIVWNKVIASKCDLIFPFENQLNGWTELCETLEIEETGSHLPDDFETLISRNIINNHLIRQKFSDSFNGNYDNNAIIQWKIASSLYDKWKETVGIRQDANILEIGCGTGFLTRLYAQNAFPSRLVLNDLCNIPTITLNLNVTDYEFIENDAELLSFPDNSFDYIVSSSAIQWFENLPKFFHKAHKWLKPQGALVLSTFGIYNMKEINDYIKISLNYKDSNWYNNEIKRNFDIVLLSEEYETMLFDSPLQVLRHIQSTGVNSVSSKNVPGSVLRHLLSSYKSVDGKFQLTYNPIYIIAINNK